MKTKISLAAICLLVFTFEFLYVRNVASQFGSGNNERVYLYSAPAPIVVLEPDASWNARDTTMLTTLKEFESSHDFVQQHKPNEGSNTAEEIDQPDLQDGKVGKSTKVKSADFLAPLYEYEPIYNHAYETTDLTPFSWKSADMDGIDLSNGDIEISIPQRFSSSDHQLTGPEINLIQGLEAEYAYIIANIDRSKFTVQDGASWPEYKYYSRTVDSCQVRADGWDKERLFRFSYCEHQRDKKIRMFFIYEDGNITAYGYYGSKHFRINSNGTDTHSGQLTAEEVTEILSFIHNVGFWK